MYVRTYASYVLKNQNGSKKGETFMDETVKVYNPTNSYIIVDNSKLIRRERIAKTSVNNAAKRKSIRDSIKQTRYETMCEVFNDHEKQEKVLVSKHGWVNLFYNWAIVVLLVLLIIAMISWANTIRNERKVASMFASAMADFDAKQAAIAEQAAEDQRKLEQSEAFVEQKMATELALIYQGADKFTDKYGYSEADFKTYGRCVFNRVESPLYPNDIFEVIEQPNQWVGFNSSSTPIDKYYKMALEHVHEWRNETTKPCSNDYLWAELTPNGIYLKNDFHADGYAIRWRAN